MPFDRCCACQGANLDKFIQPIILSILQKEGGITGYRIVKNISAYATFAGTAPDASGIYRYLKAMADRGLIEKRSSGAEEGYYLCSEGEQCLENWRKTIAGYCITLEALNRELKK